MERLTMYEVIEHCKRKTQNFERTFRKEHLESDDCGVADILRKEYWEHRQVAEWLEELKSYKTAEEQGLLLRLPCKVGTKVWFIREITSVRHELIETEVEKVILKKRGLHIKLLCNSFYETTCNSIGKTVFFTREEAEQALAEMQKG